jgi:pimeloyl-ACP methyl ester carboxylesterase
MKPIVLVILAGFSFLHIHSQDISGSWQGRLGAGGGNLRFVLNLSKTADGWHSSFDSPDQKVFGIAGAKTRFVNDSIYAEVTQMQAAFAGKWDGKDEISGVFAQGPMKMDLNLKRVANTEKPKEPIARARPQTPQPPFSYDVEEVEYDNADKSIHFGATYTKPKGATNVPSVIIITGSGTQDRDGTLFGHKLYAVLADHLTKQGIGVLRVDDRGIGKTTMGSQGGITSDILSKDVEASLNYLLSRTDVNRKKIGLIGHSEGGIIAPMVAARRKDVAFVVLWGAPIVGGKQINTQQNGYVLRKAGVDSNAVKAFMQLHENILSQFTGTGKDALDAKIDALFSEWRASQPKNIQSALYVTDKTIVAQDIHAMYHSLYDLPWMNFFISYDPVKDLAKLSCPVLAVNGTKDTQVDATTDLALINSVLTKSGNKSFRTMPLFSLNHLLQTAKTGDDAEYETLEETIAPYALTIISSWIKVIVK